MTNLTILPRAFLQHENLTHFATLFPLFMNLLNFSKSWICYLILDWIGRF